MCVHTEKAPFTLPLLNFQGSELQNLTPSVFGPCSGTTARPNVDCGDKDGFIRRSAHIRAHVRWVTRSWGGWKQKLLWLAQWGHFNSCLQCLCFSSILHRLPRPLVPYSSGRPLCSFIYWQQGGERIAICRSNCLIHLVRKQCCFEWPVNVLHNNLQSLSFKLCNNDYMFERVLKCNFLSFRFWSFYIYIEINLCI